MSIRHIRVCLRHFTHHSRPAQIGLIFALWFLGAVSSKLLGLPLPGGIIGQFLAIALLATGGVSLFTIKRGAQWFLADMLLFFVPAVLAVLDHREFVGPLGIKILAVIVISTVAVMATTAMTIDLMFRWSESRERHAA